MAELYTPEEVARRLRVSKKAVYSWLQRNKLAGIKVGNLWRIPREALEEFTKLPWDEGHATRAAAPSSDAGEWIDEDLERLLILILDELADNAARWDSMEEHERVSWSLDWDHEILDYLGRLERRSVAGQMTPSQSRRYGRLLVLLEERLPVIERLGLTPPQFDVEAAMARLRGC